jgi:hypothetical protein
MSRRLIGIEFRFAFDPEEGVAFAVGVQLYNLRRDPVAHGLRACIRHDEAQFAQALPSAPRAHHSLVWPEFGNAEDETLIW